MRGCFIVLDFETTGMSPASGARATEVGAVRVEDGRIVARFQSLMNAGAHIPPFIQRLTGITNAMITAAPPCGEVMQRFHDFLGDAPLVAHNAPFDRKFLDAELALSGLAAPQPMICSMRIARRILSDAPNHKLGTLVGYAGIETDGVFHRALADAEKTAHLMLSMAARVRQLQGISLVDYSLMSSLQNAPRSRRC
jgi:DNA polymerase-3 subunit epsilon